MWVHVHVYVLNIPYTSIHSLMFLSQHMCIYTISTADNKAIAIPGGNFGNGVGPVHVTGLVCNGDEIALIDCFTVFTFFSLFCRSSSAAGVLCPRKCPIY